MYPLLLPGDSAPWFSAKLIDGPEQFRFDSAAGRPIVMLLMGSASTPGVADALALVAQSRHLLNDSYAAFFGISIDPRDESEKRLVPQRPGIRFFVDPGAVVSARYGAAVQTDAGTRYTPHWLLFDQTLRVVATAPLGDGATIFAALEALHRKPDELDAPVLVVPRVFDPAICRTLIDYYERKGGVASGFMSDSGGMTRLRMDESHKRRSDCLIEEADLQQQVAARIMRFLVPAVARSFRFEATRIERFLVGCYNSEDGGGHFRSHRDDTTVGTSHRRFACTINLNAEDYEGGDLCFPEFGKRTYRAPTGGAVIFSCSLLHEAKPVTTGKRYAFLPFLHDEAAEAVRLENLKFLDLSLAAATA